MYVNNVICFGLAQGIRRITPLGGSKEPPGKQNQPITSSKGVTDFQFYSVLELQGVNEEMLENAR